MQHVPLKACDTTFNISFSTVIHLTENFMISFFCTAKYSFLKTCHIFIIHPSVEKHFGWFIFSSYCVCRIPRNDWFIYNIIPILKTQWPTKESGQKPFKSQSVRKPLIWLCILYMREHSSMKHQNYGWLNNTWTMTTPVNIGIWMVQSSWGLKSYGQ